MKKSIIHFTAGTPGAQESGGKTKDATATTLPAATTAKKEPVLVMKDRKIVNTHEISEHITSLLNQGFYVKNNEQKGTLSANRYGKKGHMHVEMMADNVIITKKGEAPLVKTYQDYQEALVS